MGEIVTTIFSSFVSVITNIATGIKSAFDTILWVDPAAPTKELSDIAKFGFIFLGVSLAIGIVYAAVRLIRR